MKTICLFTLLMAAPGMLVAKNWREFAGADPRTAGVANPYEGHEEAVRAGEKLYLRYCATCHGTRAEGSAQAPPLNGAAVGSLPPGKLFWLLRNGSLARGMPSWSHLPPEQRWQIVTFLKTYMKESLTWSKIPFSEGSFSAGSSSRSSSNSRRCSRVSLEGVRTSRWT